MYHRICASGAGKYCEYRGIKTQCSVCLAVHGIENSVQLLVRHSDDACRCDPDTIVQAHPKVGASVQPCCYAGPSLVNCLMLRTGTEGEIIFVNHCCRPLVVPTLWAYFGRHYCKRTQCLHMLSRYFPSYDFFNGGFPFLRTQKMLDLSSSQKQVLR